jgi:hypothetical protein
LLDQTALGLGLGCENCLREWPNEAALLAEVEALEAEAWSDLPSFVRIVMTDEGTERALRRFLKPLLVAGVEAEIVLELAGLVNDRRARPLAPAAVSGLAVEVAREIAAAHRQAVR